MNILYLGVSPFSLTPIIKESGCDVIECNSKVDVNFLRKHKIDFAVSYRCPNIIRKPVINYLQGNIINLHISLLPWNRGSDPNLWSFLENTPKGVTIHYLEEGLDTGKIIAQKKIIFDGANETLATTYNKLDTEIIALFKEKWPAIMRGEIAGKDQQGRGTMHVLKDKNRFLHLITKKEWNTSVSDLINKAIN
jgi:methionyl-tRNA formyltransferase